MSSVKIDVHSLFKFLTYIVGDLGEVVLHDLEKLDYSVISIHNGHISGRNIGAPATDLVLKLIKENFENDATYVAPYKTYSKSGRVLKSSTYLFRDSNNVLKFALCVNLNIGSVLEVKQMLESISSFLDEDTVVKESFNASYEDVIYDTITNFVTINNLDLLDLTLENKKLIVENANECGIFLMKGSIPIVAKILSVSEPTVYRYLSDLKKN